MIMDFTTYIKPELVILIGVLFAIGAGAKKTEAIKDKYIPVLLGTVGVVLAALWVAATTAIHDAQSALMAVFVGLTQGILCAAASVYADQVVFKQPKRDD